MSDRDQECKHAPRAGEARFREIADSLPQTIFEADVLGRITFANAFSFQQFGYGQEDIDAGLNIFQVVAPDDRARAMGLAQRVLGGEREVLAEVQGCRRDGSTFPMLVSSNPVEQHGQVVGMRGMLMDISLQKNIETSLRESQERYRALVENQSELVMRWLPDMTLTYVNPAYCRFFEKNADQLLGRKFLEQVPEIYHGYITQRIATVLEKPRIEYFEFQSIAADGRPAWHRWSDTPILDPDGKVVEFQSVGMDITELKEAYQKLHHSELRYQYLAQHDPLTGLPNRLLLLDRLRHVMAKARRFNRSFALLTVDLDRFKKVADMLGHDGADRALVEVGKRMSEVVRESDILAKVSGDQFVIVCDEIRGPEGPAKLAQLLLNSISIPLQVDGHILALTATVGIALWGGGDDGGETLLKQAYMAMSEGKLRGGNNYTLFSSDLAERSREEESVGEMLRRAIDTDALHLVFLPQFDLASGRLAGVEALVRMQVGDGQELFPGSFVPVAEKTGLIQAMGDWVLEEACRQNSRWQAQGLPTTVITVNVSSEQFAQADFCQKVMVCLEKYALEPRWLELEIKESAIMENVAHAVEVMNALAQAGVSFAIDDFGKGYSSLTHLRHLPVSKLKIDRSFTRDVPNNELDVKLIHSVVALARSLDLKTVVEGMERPGQCAFFRDMRCDLAQGHVFGEPCTAQTFADLMNDPPLDLP